jgi:uncharacterized protein YkwD
MNIIDLVLILIIIISAWSGFRKGFFISILDLIGWVGSLLVAIYFYKDVAALYEEHAGPMNAWTFPIIFILLVIISRIIFSSISSLILRNIRPETHQHSLNKVFGVGPGLINGLINAIIIAALLLALPISDRLTQKTRDSRMAGKLAAQVEWLDDQLSPVFDEAINRSINKMTVEPDSRKSVSLPFKVSNPRIREDLEAKMLELVNEERSKEGLPALKADPELAVVARAHSRDMFARGYFAHLTPEGKTPSDRANAAKVKYQVVGENLALGQTLSICHNGLMNSPGHRANILQTAYGRVGIGILDGGIYGLMITQNFRD